MRSIQHRKKDKAAEEAAEQGDGADRLLKAVEETAEQGDGADLLLKAGEEAAEQGDASDLVSVLLGNLSHLAGRYS